MAMKRQYTLTVRAGTNMLLLFASTVVLLFPRAAPNRMERPKMNHHQFIIIHQKNPWKQSHEEHSNHQPENTPPFPCLHQPPELIIAWAKLQRSIDWSVVACGDEMLHRTSSNCEGHACNVI